MKQPELNFQYDFVGLGRRIQLRRKELGLTQNQLSTMIQCSPTHLARIECGSRPSLDFLIRVSHCLNLSLDEMLGVVHCPSPSILREVYTLFLNHSTEDQQLALRLIRVFFSMVEDIEMRTKKRAIQLATEQATNLMKAAQGRLTSPAAKTAMSATFDHFINHLKDSSSLQEPDSDEEFRADTWNCRPL